MGRRDADRCLDGGRYLRPGVFLAGLVEMNPVFRDRVERTCCQGCVEVVDAEARCLGGENTRGWYAAEAAIETARVYRQIG